MDDGSTDGTAAIVRRHAAADPRVRLVDGTAAAAGLGRQEPRLPAPRRGRPRHAPPVHRRRRPARSRTPRQPWSRTHAGDRRGAGQRCAAPGDAQPRRASHRADDQLPAAGLPADRPHAGHDAAGAGRRLRPAPAGRQRKPTAPQAAMPPIRGLPPRRAHAGPPVPRAGPSHRSRCRAPGSPRCRMYRRASSEAWAGFLKNAHEGMARPLALPVWTVLLAGGHILPPVLLARGPCWARARSGRPPWRSLLSLRHPRGDHAPLRREPVDDPAASGDRGDRAGDPVDGPPARTRPAGELEGPRLPCG